jgi:MFS transporter, FSR family, fosmidomycin resistance protein
MFVFGTKTINLIYSYYRMTNNSQENTESVTPDKAGETSVVKQWGGKFAFFFSYMHLSHDLTTGLLPALLPFIREDLGLNYLQAGFLVSAFSLTAGLSQLLGGWLSDRISKTKAISLGLGGVGLCAVAMSFASSYYVLLIILIGLGIFAGFYHPSSISALTTQIETQRRGRAVALHMVGGGLGFGLGPLLGAVIASKFNWHLAYSLLGLPTLFAAVMVLTQLKLTPHKKPVETASSRVLTPKYKGIWQVFKPVMGILALSIAMQLITGPVMAFVSLFLMDVHHLTAAAGSMWVTIIRFGGLAGNLVGGWLTDKWGRRNTIFLTLIIFGPILFLIARLSFGFALGVVFIIFGWLMAIREATMQTLLMDNSPPHLRATIIGIYFSFGQQGSSIIQPIAGGYMDMMGIDGVFNAFAGISIGLSVLAVILVFRVLRSRKNNTTNTSLYAL